MHFSVLVYIAPTESLEEHLWPYFEQMSPDEDPDGKYITHVYETEDGDYIEGPTEDDVIEQLKNLNIDMPLAEPIYYNNFNSKWDWWVIGGRWSNWILGKDGNKYDTAAIDDINMYGMCTKNRSLFMNYYEKLNLLFSETDDISDHNKLYHEACMENPIVFPELFLSIKEISTYDKKDFEKLKLYQGIQTHDVLDSDGVWHEQGEGDPLAWATECRRIFLKERRKEANIQVYMIDCHV